MKTTPRTAPAVHDLGPAAATFRAEVLAGLRRPHKQLPCKYFYDDAGSRLFDRICELPEYYPTRTELAIMRDHAPAMAERLGPGVQLVEYGSGSSVKTRLLLDALQRPAAYLPVDIARDHLARTAAALAADYPGLAVRPVCADFTRSSFVLCPLSFVLRQRGDPPGCKDEGQRTKDKGQRTKTVVYFPGSTIGNFGPRAARRLLAGMARLAGPGGAVLIGVDLKKDPRVLEAAYDDAAGVTAAFNLNLLARINRELGGDFDLRRFRHHALYNPTFGRVEMHLLSRRRQTVRVAGAPVPFDDGEGVRTECSYKFTVRGFQELAAEAGLRPRQVWTDPRRWFSVQLFTAG